MGMRERKRERVIQNVQQIAAAQNQAIAQRENNLNNIEINESNLKNFGQRANYGSQAGIEQYVGKRID